MTADELDKEIHNFICKQGAYPASLGFYGFPKSLCISVNEGE